MTVEYSIRVADAFGQPLFETQQFLEAGNQPGLHYVLSAGKIGALTVTLPSDFDTRLVKDGRIGVWRSVNGGAAKLDGESVFLIRRWDYGDDWTTVTALHANHLLFRRYVMYTPGARYAGGSGGVLTYFAGKILPADYMIKDVANENYGALIVNADRFGTDTRANVVTYLTVAPNVSLGPSLDLENFAGVNIYDFVQQVCDASMAAGTYLIVEIVAPTEGTLELRTYTTLRGVDRRASTGSPLLFSRERGNLENAILTIDATNEITFAAVSPDNGYTLGTSLNLPGDSPFDRIEVFANSNTTNTTALGNEAAALVRNGRPIKTLTADLVETDTAIRGVHFDYGDLVTVEHRGQQFDARLDVLEISVQQGQEQTRMQFRSHT